MQIIEHKEKIQSYRIKYNDFTFYRLGLNKQDNQIY